MSPTSDIQGSLLDFALSCGIGVTVFRAGTSTTDTPFVYCMGLIFKKGQDYKIVAYDLLSGNVSTNRKPQNISEWVGWVNLVTNSDLQNQAVLWYFLIHNSSNSESDAISKVNNPTLLIGGSSSGGGKPYCILLSDTQGTSIFGGGITCVWGYEYNSGLHGFQIVVKYDRNIILMRNKRDGAWSELVKTTVS